MSTIQERIETVLSEHVPNADSEWCTLENCYYEFGAEGFHQDMEFEEAFARHLYDVLAPLIREAQAEAFREAADKFQTGDWHGVLQGGAVSRIGNGQRVTDWLRARADRLAT